MIDNWWRQGMDGGAKAQYDCIKAFSETDFTEDLKMIEVPTLVLHGEDDQIVPIDDSARLVKKAVVGVGNAEKAQVHAMVQRLLPGARIAGADAADALAVAITHAHHLASARRLG